MTTPLLTPAQIQQFQTDGYVFPVPVLPIEQANTIRAELEAFEATQGGKLSAAQRNKSFMLFKWIDELIHDARVLDPIEQLIGPNILCWNTIFWIKDVGSKSFISWHQDTTYWGLSSRNVVTAWLALSPATIESGCMKVMPGSHEGDVLRHEDTFDDDNMLTRGQTIIAGINEARAVYMPLATGEMSLHNYRAAHGSGPNLANDRRIGLSMHFMPTETEQIVGDWDTAALVRGEDKHKNFVHVPRPSRDFDPELVPVHEKANTALREVLYAGARMKNGKMG
ncbi:MAG: phytanoyl-CoA dioxygenase family protein [Burkholderiaceae bacterium]